MEDGGGHVFKVFVIYVSHAQFMRAGKWVRCIWLFFVFPTALLPEVKAVPGFEQALNKCVEHWTQDINKIMYTVAK